MQNSGTHIGRYKRFFQTKLFGGISGGNAVGSLCERNAP